MGGSAAASTGQGRGSGGQPAGAQDSDCCCCASVAGMVSLVSATAQTAITAITAIAATTGSGPSIGGSPGGSIGNMASLTGSVNAGADVGYVSSLVNTTQGDAGASIQNVSYVSSNFSDPNWVEAVLPTTFAQNDARLLAHLSEARKYEFFIRASSERAGLLPSIVAGIGSRESGWGLSLKPRGPGGTGDPIPRPSTALRSGPLPPDGGGFGRGLMQIDWDAQPFARTGNWSDPAANIDVGCQILRQSLNLISTHINLQPFDLLLAAIAAYNAGAGNVLTVISQQGINAVDSVTTGRNYSTDVMNRAGWFQAQGFWRQVAAGGADGMGIVV